MGIDLILLPLAFKNSWMSTDVLQVERNEYLFRGVQSLERLMIPAEGIACYVARLPNGEKGFGHITRDSYDERLTYTTVNNLMVLQNYDAVKSNWKNRAIWAYLGQMESEWPVCLYWD